jgi:signal transduction histidine kinase
MTPGWSLRGRLLAALVALTAALFAVSAIQDFLAYRRTSERLFDDSLRQSAGLMMQLVQHEVAEHGQMLGLELLKAETQPGPYAFRFQVWTRDMQAGYLSSGGPATPFVEFGTEGFATTRIDGEDWRTYSLWNEPRTLQVQVAQRQHVRAAGQRQALLRLVASSLVLLLAATILIWWIVGASIRPLRAVAAVVHGRNDEDLSPVDETGMPREVRPLLVALNRLLERISATLAAERRFTSDAAHELRTPLAAIRANAQVLLAARDAAERERTTRDLLASVDRGARLVEQLLALAHADRPGEVVATRKVDLAGVAADQELAHRRMAERLGVQLRSQLRPAPMRGDAGLLAVMMRNLIDNALRHAPQGSRVTITTDCTMDGAELVVEDEGPGIPPAERQSVFERFYRLPGSPATGSGLGLSIVLRIVELHGGRISVADGAGGRGARIRVVFAPDSGLRQHGAGEAAERPAAIAPGFEPGVRRSA